MKKLANFLGILSAILSSFLFVKNRAPGGFALFWIPKLLSGALAPVNAVLGGIAAFLGLWTRSAPASLLGGLSAAASAHYVTETVKHHDQFERAFGPRWKEQIPLERRLRLKRKRWNWPQHSAPGIRVPQPGLQKDVVFWTIAGAEERKLLADIWTPPAGVPGSGLAFVYLHGSDWYLMDKDFATRPFFRHLTAQGHLVMDVAYRLYPETDMNGMVGDVKRAVAWMKANAARFQIDPDRIVVGGGSSGGHLALLAAYTADHPDLTPGELHGRDLSVRAVISEYGPTDLAACYTHTQQHITTMGKKRQSVEELQPRAGSNAWLRKAFKDYDRLGMNRPTETGTFYNLLGDHPDKAPELYARFSPQNYVGPDCPPTLLIQGEDDLITPAEATRVFYRKLLACKVPVVNVIFPQTDHGFDLVLPAISPTAQSALYDIDRFLALMSAGKTLSGYAAE